MLSVCTKGLRVTQFQFSVCMYGTCGRTDNKADFDKKKKFNTATSTCTVLRLDVDHSKYMMSGDLKKLQLLIEEFSLLLYKIKKYQNIQALKADRNGVSPVECCEKNAIILSFSIAVMPSKQT